MSKKKCKTCLFRDKCYSVENCNHYSSLDDEFDEDKYIEVRRQDFYEEWEKYLAGQNK